MSFEKRQLGVTIKLEEGTFSESGTGEVKLPALRMSAKMLHAGGPSDGTLDLQIFGMTKSLMNQLSTLGMQINLQPKNTITVTAGTEEEQSTVVFVGYIISAFADFNAAPEVAFNVCAHTLAPQGVIPATPTSYTAPVSAATVMSGLAAQMGLRFENNGVDVMLPPSYFSGSYKTQALAVVEAAGISWNNGALGTLAIWPRNGSRDGAGQQMPIVSKDTGMVGYPSYTANGIMLKTLFNPGVVGIGQKIKVVSDVLAEGEWTVYTIDHELDCQVPDGAWFSQLLCYSPTLPNRPAVK